MEVYNQLKKYSKEIQEIAKKANDLIPFNKWVSIPRDEMVLENIYIEGIYVLYSLDEIFYIGISSNIGARVLGHLNRYGKIITKIKIKKLNSWELAEITEMKLIHRIRPKNNKYIPSKYSIKIKKEMNEIK